MAIEQEPAFYFYKLTTDNGGAPCVAGGLLSLAICKARIRSGARVNDVIFGFGGKRLGERLLYVAVVTAKEEAGEYYRKRKYQDRPDCIYRWKGNVLEWKKSGRYHEGGSTTDVGPAGKHVKAAVLLSSDFRYFGAEGTTDYKARFPAIQASVEVLKRGERRNHLPELRRELGELKAWVWGSFGSRKVGRPTDGAPADMKRRCNGEGRVVRVGARGVQQGETLEESK